MKRFKIGFLAIIALAAMSFTIAEHQGAFEKKLRAGTCNPGDWAELQIFSVEGECDDPTILASRPQATACNKALIGHLVASLDIPEQPGFNCNGEDEIFCCAVLAEEKEVCNGEEYDVIAEILCYDPTQP